MHARIAPTAAYNYALTTKENVRCIMELIAYEKLTAITLLKRTSSHASRHQFPIYVDRPQQLFSTTLLV